METLRQTGAREESPKKWVHPRHPGVVIRIVPEHPGTHNVYSRWGIRREEEPTDVSIPSTYPDGSGSLTPAEWLAWAKRELLYGTNPLPK